MKLEKESLEFAGYLETWFNQLSPEKLTNVIQDAHKTAVFCVDVTNGFCYHGILASPRVAGIVNPIVDLFTRAHAAGVNTFVLPQDTHSPDAVEFADFPAHCISGTEESQTVAAIQALPFADKFQVFPKNSINSFLNTGLTEWIQKNPQLDTFIVVGDCSDLCVYQLAMHLRLDANARQIKRRVILPENCLQTYDTPIEIARANHLNAHPGDLFHAMSLYHMFLNGIEIVKELE